MSAADDIPAKLATIRTIAPELNVPGLLGFLVGAGYRLMDPDEYERFMAGLSRMLSAFIDVVSEPEDGS